MSVKLWEIDALIEDAAECIRDASRKAMEASGLVVGHPGGTVRYRETCIECNGTGDGERSPCGGYADTCPACGGTGHYEAEYTIPDIPSEEGWPAMLALVDRLDRLAEEVSSCICPEVAEAIKTEKAYDDEMADRADGQSY